MDGYVHATHSPCLPKLTGLGTRQFDPTLQYKAYITYSLSNPYRSLITSSQANSYTNSYNQKCFPALNTCISSGTNKICENADNTCYDDIEGPISEGNFDVYDLRAPANDPFPPETYVSYLQQSSIQTQIGAQQEYQECPDAPYEKFVSTGDGSPPSLVQSCQ
jgi:carboxypeptidase C (cathepsin A)